MDAVIQGRWINVGYQAIAFVNKLYGLIRKKMKKIHILQKGVFRRSEGRVKPPDSTLLQHFCHRRRIFKHASFPALHRFGSGVTTFLV